MEEEITLRKYVELANTVKEVFERTSVVLIAA